MKLEEFLALNVKDDDKDYPTLRPSTLSPQNILQLVVQAFPFLMDSILKRRVTKKEISSRWS